MRKYFNVLLAPLFCLVLLFGCKTSQSSKHVDFGVSQKYKLDLANEKEEAISQKYVTHYETVINLPDLNLPLNKFVVGPNYNVYLGVDFSNKPFQTLDIFSQSKAHLVLAKEMVESDSKYDLLFKHGKSFVYMKSYLSKKDKMQYIACVESDSVSAHKFFTTKFFDSKLEIK